VASLTHAQLDAANEFARETVTSFETDNVLDAGTAIAGAARMAGTFLFRSFRLPVTNLQPGTVVLSEEANEQWPQLIQVLGGMLVHLGTSLDPAELGGAPPPEQQAKLSLLDSQRRLEPGYVGIRARHGLSLHQAAESAAAAAALLIHHYAEAFDPHLAFDLAVYGFIEGAKTAPDPVVA
jgi:hypothetical protein